MVDQITNYYKSYYDANGYTMEKVKDSSRVAILVDWIKKYTPINGTILDIGCGDMYLAELLPEYKWTGIDVNLKEAKGNAVEHDIMKRPYPFKTGQFDTIICSEVLEHVWDLRVIHKEAKRLLSDKGTYLLSTPNFDHVDHFITHFREFVFDVTKPWLFEHIRFYNFEAHNRIVSGEGFKVEEFCGADAHYTHMFVQARQELLKALAPKGLTQVDVDVLLGKSFALYSHTIMLAAKKS